MKISELFENYNINDVNHYISQISSIKFINIDNSTWETIQYEGLDEEQDAPNKNQWKMSFLNLSDSDKEGLQNYDADSINKFNLFDITLKEKYNGKIVDLIDYDAGIIRLVKVNEINLSEGGWASTLTQNTVITPNVVVKAVNQYNQFINDFNNFLKIKNIPEVKAGHPVGSTNYYKRDLVSNPNKEYGDIDILLFIPKLKDKSDAQISEIYKKLVIEFCQNKSDISTDSGHAVIFKLNNDDYVQVDLVFAYYENKEWLKALVPEYNIKGVLSASLYSSLAELLNLSISSNGIQVKLRDNKPVSFRQSKHTTLKIISTDPKHWALDILYFYHNLINPTGRLTIAQTLKDHSGINPENLKISDIVLSIKGLADSLESNGANGWFGYGPLSHIKNKQDFMNQIKTIYTSKINSRMNDSKFNKAETEKAKEKVIETKKKLQAGLEKILELLK